MGLVRADEILKMAVEANTAVISFITIDYNMVSAVLRAAETARKPAIVMLLPEQVTNNRVADIESYAAMCLKMMAHCKAPVALHLDHSYDEDEVRFAIDAGFPSVMFDASRDDLETNIRRTRAVVEYAHARGVVVESELGSIGWGKDEANGLTDSYTKPEAVRYFCESTGVDSLAISIGNAHGDYKLPPHLDLKRLDEINAATDVPLVLHGGSGIPEDQLVEAFSRGINKFNFGTDVLRCYDRAIRAYHDAHQPPSSLDYLGIPAAAQDAMTEFIVRKMSLTRMTV